MPNDGTNRPTGRLRGSRNKLSEAVICALLRDFSKHGEKAIAKVRRDHPGIYLKVLALLIPRQDKLEHTNTIKTMTDEELESAIAFLREMMAAQAVGSAHLVEMKAEPAALPAPGGQSPEKLSSKRKPNRLMMEVICAGAKSTSTMRSLPCHRPAPRTSASTSSRCRSRRWRSCGHSRSASPPMARLGSMSLASVPGPDFRIGAEPRRMSRRASRRRVISRS